MNTDLLLSVAVLIVIAVGGFVCAWTIGKRLRSSGARFAFAIVLCVPAFLSLWFIDTSLPLSASHYRASGTPAPVWVAALAWWFRVAALAAMILGSRDVSATEASDGQAERKSP